jgi:hypothetical protein
MKISLLCSTLCAACLHLIVCSATAQPAEPDWRNAARDYLDSRMTAWLAWPQAQEHGGDGTRCISCHTAVPITIARSRLGEASDAQAAMLDNIRQRVARWDEIAAWNGADGSIRPFYAGSRKSAALATESIVNALVLTHAEPRGGDGILGQPARRALEIMWSTQNARGAWDWLDFDLRPWELDAEYLGAAWAAIAVGRAGPAYYEVLSEVDQARLGRLRSYLKDRYAQESLHNRLTALWAATFLDGILDPPQRQALIDEVFALDPEGNGWTLTALAKQPNNMATWQRVHAIPADATDDGYATSYIVYVLKRAGATHPKLARAAAWIAAQQIAAGRGPALYLNIPRYPDSSNANRAMVGKFMHDAAAAYAVLALTEGD